MPKPALYSRNVLQHLAPGLQRSEKAASQAAVSLFRDFLKFAEKSCGCEATSNRAHLRRAVFHATQDIDFAPFVASRLGGDMAPVESIARMECPVTLPGKDMVKVKVNESAPHRIVVASKALRKHLSLTETQTCRGCSKRARCRYFKAPPEDTSEVGVRHVGRVLFGMAQYSRAHLRWPEVYPFYFTDANLASARTLMSAIGEQLAQDNPYPLYGDIELADAETAREALLRDSRQKLEKHKSAMEERLLSLPQWMRETLRPVPGPSMTAKQRALLEDGGDGAKLPRPSKQEEEGQWFEEGEVPGEVVGAPLAAEPHGPQEVASWDGDGPITNIDGVESRPVPQRFQHIAPARREEPVRQFNSIAGGPTTGIFRLAGQELSHRIDLDGVAGPDFDSEAGLDVQLQGGYALAELLRPEVSTDRAASAARAGALQLVSLSPGALEGVQQYDFAVPKVDPSILENLWERAAEEDELPFITRIPFDGGLRRSGGSLPPARLPREMLLEEPEAVLPPPSREEPRRAEELHRAEPELQRAEPEDFALDEALVQRALRDRASRSLEATSPAPSPSLDMDSLGDTSRAARAPALSPSLDMGNLGDVGRFERIGRLEPESPVTSRQRAPLPHDEAFVSTFRRPLTAPPEAEPLGAAAPGVDVAQVKAQFAPEPNTELTPGGLEQDSGYIMTSTIKFPKLPVQEPPRRTEEPRRVEAPRRLEAPRRREASRREEAPVQRLPPRLGRMRQARVEDLSDLLRPGTESSRATAEERGERNAAMAAQQQLYRHMKSSMLKQFPSSRPLGQRAGQEEERKVQRRSSPVLDLANR